jgi:hypothetical protein
MMLTPMVMSETGGDEISDDYDGVCSGGGGDGDISDQS